MSQQNSDNLNQPGTTPAAKFILSAFGDEIAQDFDTQLAVLKEEEISYVELRGAWGKNVADFEEADLNQVELALHNNDIKVSAIGSPIGKIKITDSFEAEMKRLDRVIEIAQRLNTPYIRIFSFFIPQDRGEAAYVEYRDEVLHRLKEFVKVAEARQVILLHENEKDIYGDSADRCLDIFKEVVSPNFRMTFDPANFVQHRVLPYSEAYRKLGQFITYMHIKDAFLEDGRVVVAGAGEGEIEKLIQALSDKGYEGFVSLEPHLSASGTFSGFSGPQLFHEAVVALKDILYKVNRKVVNRAEI